MSLDLALRQRIDSLLQAQRVVLFMKGDPDAPQCGFSAKAVGALDDLGVQFAHVDVLRDPAIREGIKVYGDWPTIPQLYVDGELIGGSDILLQLAASGELATLLGLPEPDRTPPQLHVTPAAAQALRDALQANPGMVVGMDTDSQFRSRLQLVEANAHAVSITVDGVPFQFNAGSGLRRADGVSIDWADDARGRGLIIDNPNAPKPVQPITPADAADRVRAGTLTLVDVRPRAERAIALAPVPHRDLDAGPDSLRDLPKDAPIAFLCHHGGRSGQAAEHFRGLGHTQVFNVEGGIDAWAAIDPAVPRY